MIARLLTAALFLIAARWAYRAGYQAARLDALPWWHISRARKAETLRYLDWQRMHR